VVGASPPSDFDSARLRLHTVAAGERFGRIFSAGFPDPLGYGKSKSRFSDPRRRKPENRFGVLYVGESLAVCFLEAVLRDRKDGVVGGMELEEHELEERLYVDVEVASALRLVDLRGNNPVAMGVPSDVVRGVRHRLGRAWSMAFHEHPSAVDGIIYPSRLNGQVNLAVYGRAVAKLRPSRLRRLIDVVELAPVLDDLEVAIAPPDPGT
jgi:RES domain